MAHVKPLGLHGPCAGMLKLPTNGTSVSTAQKWQVFAVYDTSKKQWREDEILQTHNCVIWSRDGVVKRLFNLDVEGEEILHSFMTSFPQAAEDSHTQGPDSRSKIGLEDTNSGKASSAPSTAEKPYRGQALVIILRSKAFIYFLTGSMQSVALPFEVEAAFPTPQGCLLQRSAVEPKFDRFTPAAPPNSFISSRTWLDSQHSQATMRGDPINPARTSAQLPSLKLPTTTFSERKDTTPAILSLRDVQAEHGLVTTQGSSEITMSSPESSRRAPLDPAERLIYVSPENELATEKIVYNECLLYAVTRNISANSLTLWRAQYVPRSSEASKTSGILHPGKDRSGVRRPSSNMLMASGSTTPLGRSLGASRESLGPQLGRSIPEHWWTNEGSESEASRAETFATELAPEFTERGVQTRAARRVSSMLARTDLSTVTDRVAVGGFASRKSGRRSSQRSGLNGESFGLANDVHSLGVVPRSSLTGVSPSIQPESSLPETPVSRLLTGPTGVDAAEQSHMARNDAWHELPTDVVLSKLSCMLFSESDANTDSTRDRIKVYSLVIPNSKSPGHANAAAVHFSIYVLNCNKAELLVIDVQGTPKPRKKHRHRKRREPEKKIQAELEFKVVNQRRSKDIVDISPVRDGNHNAMLFLSKNSSGQQRFHLELLNATLFRLEVPQIFPLFNPLDVDHLRQKTSKWRTGQGRLTRAKIKNLNGVGNASCRGQVDLIDGTAQCFRISIKLEPHQPFVRKVLTTAEIVLQSRQGRGISVAWNEVMKWLQARGQKGDLEWPAMVITLFSMLVPFLGEEPSKKTDSGVRRTQHSHGHSTSGGGLNMASWDAMMQEAGEKRQGVRDWTISPSWHWTGLQNELSVATSNAKSGRSMTSRSGMPAREDVSLRQCVSWAREFMHTTAGHHMIGAEGYLPTAVNQHHHVRSTAIPSILVALHLLREERKLDIRSAQAYDDDVPLLAVLAQIGMWLRWPRWGPKNDSYYESELVEMNRQSFDDSKLASLDVISQPYDPPSIFKFVETCLSQNKATDFPTLHGVVGSQDPEVLRTMTRRSRPLTPRTWTLLTYLKNFVICGQDAAMIEILSEDRVCADMLATLPAGVAAAIFEVLTAREKSEASLRLHGLLHTSDRQSSQGNVGSTTSLSKLQKPLTKTSHTATRDYHSIAGLVLDTEPSHPWDIASEEDREGVTKLIFRDDRRFQDASRLVNQLRPPVVECQPEPDWSEADLLEAQKHLVPLVAMRTLAVATGRGMISYGARVPLLTEKISIPAFNLQCHIRPTNITSSADRAAFSEDRVAWAFFHNGVAAGLTIAREARGIDTSWIQYSKPPEPTNRHAGFLMALGLNGHLKSLAKWVAFKYLTTKHTMTSIGLLLGLSASYLGTMDILITRLLSVNIVRMLPIGAAELNVPASTQTAGIMGVGLLYCFSQHRRMSEVMMSEIENNDVEEGEPIQHNPRDEGYRLASGFSLGLINLAQGKRLYGLRDMNIESRLLACATSTRTVHLVHVLDRATAGATIAYGLIYLKTNDPSIASRIDIPDTLHQFGYVRPDIFLVRTVARHLIMWDSITPTFEFVRASLPKAYRLRASLAECRVLVSEDMVLFNVLAGICLAVGLRFAGSGSYPARDLLTYYFDHFIRLTRLPAPNYDAKLTRNAVRNCQDACSLALAAVMAGTGDVVVLRRLRSLHGRLDPETPYGSHMAAHMAVGILFLGGGTYTLGTSNLAIAAMLSAFYPIFPTNVADNHAHLQAFRHLWVLAVEARCIVPRDADTGKPISAPIVLVMRDNCSPNSKVAASASTDPPTQGAPRPRAEREKRLTAPCLLPDLDDIEEIRTEGRDYWNVCINLLHNVDTKRKQQEAFRQGRHLNVTLRRRAAYDAPRGSVFVSELRALAEQGRAPSVVGLSSSLSSPLSGDVALSGESISTDDEEDINPLGWIWQLPTFHGLLDASERALVLPPHGHTADDLSGLARITGELNDDSGVAAQGWPNDGEEVDPATSNQLRGTIVDTRLEVEFGILDDGLLLRKQRQYRHHHGRPSGSDNLALRAAQQQQHSSNSGDRSTVTMRRDTLWQLRLLFAWTDAQDRRQEQGNVERAQSIRRKDRRNDGAKNNDDGDGNSNMGGNWLRRATIEQLRWRVWRMRMDVAEDNDNEAEHEHEHEQERESHDNGDDDDDDDEQVEL